MRGKPSARLSITVSTSDHPRGCGENTASTLSDRRILRITPADAGKTYMRQQNTTITKDHPRGCGENIVKSVPSAKLVGSPPRMRGKPCRRRVDNQLNRITPADAGKTSDSNAVYGASKDHPRGCGENAWSSSVSPARSGSPPRMRGKRLL